jgi:hypothetical protein
VIEVPLREGVPQGRPGRIRAVIEFLQRLTPDGMARLKAAVRQRLDVLWRTSDSGDTLKLLDDMELELRSLERETGVRLEKLQMKFEEELGDFFIVELQTADRPALDVAA